MQRGGGAKLLPGARYGPRARPLIPQTLPALRDSYLLSNELPLGCAPAGRRGTLLARSRSWVTMGSCGFLWVPLLTLIA